MNRITLRARVGKGGILQLTVPPEVAGADEEVQVNIERVRPEMTQEEWQQWVLSVSGTWEGPFERPDQGELQERDSFQ